MTTLRHPLVVTRDQIVAAARAWRGTPYHHQASVCGVGADCLGLVRGVWRTLYGTDAEAPPGYSRDWAEATSEETLLSAAMRHLVLRELADAGAGDVLVFRFRPGVAAKHVAIQTTASTMVHAIDGAAACEVSLSPWWRRRIAGTFAFPGVAD